MTARSLSLVLAAVTSLVAGCKDEAPPEGELLVEAMIGPAGGELVGAGVTLTVPPGAVPVETTFQLRTANDNLSASSYRQTGTAYRLYPDALALALPAQLTFDNNLDNPAVLFRQDGLTVAGDGLTTYINELGLIAAAEAGVRLTNATEPIFAPTPEAATTVTHDTLHFALQVTDAPTVDLVLTLYDFDNVHMQDLNGVSSEGDCGFQLQDVTGASLSAGCTEGPITAQLRVTSPNVAFDAVPFQAGKVNPAVPVSVIAGGTDLAYFMGFVKFDTSPCYEEVCDNQGTCVVDDATMTGSCTCNPGFATDEVDPFSCVCVPQCEGRECGQDFCGGSCGDCNPENEYCDDASGQCIFADPTGSDTDGTTGDATDSTTTSGSDSGSSTTMESGSSSSSTGMAT